jgi:hypothetical protein
MSNDNRYHYPDNPLRFGDGLFYPKEEVDVAVEDLRDEMTALREQLSRAEKERDEAGQVAEAESRERQRLQVEADRRGLFDPRIADHIRRTERYEASDR